MSATGVRNYPVTIMPDGPGRFRATLIDLPAGPHGRGDSDKAALRDLTDRVVPVLNDMAARGEALAPSEVEDRPFIGVSPQIAIQPLPGAPAAQPKTSMLNYGWTDSKPRGGA